MGLLTRHPWLVFGLGFAAGFYAHKHRKDIIEAATRGAEQAKAAFERQSANMEELMAFKHH